MKMSPKSIRDRFNKLAKTGGEAIIRTPAEWAETGLDKEYGALPKGHMAIAVFNGAVQENTQSLRITGVTEDCAALIVEVRTNLLGGPPSRPGHTSSPRDVIFVPESDKHVAFDYKGIVQPLHRQTPPKAKP